MIINIIINIQVRVNMAKTMEEKKKLNKILKNIKVRNI